MKKQNLILLLLITLIFSCSPEDSQQNEEEPTTETSKLYKKTEGFYDGILTVSQEVFYNSNSNIESITINETDYLNRIYTVSYSGTNITGITRETDILHGTEEIINYNNVTITDESIVMISGDGVNKLEIYHTNGYVDSTKVSRQQEPYGPNILEQRFIRNSENDLIASITGADIFEYSNFDTDKKLDPFGSVIEYEHSTFFLIFGLQVTNRNPLTATYSTYSGDGTYSYYPEYDEQGYVVKMSYDEPNSTTNYSVNEYIEQ